MGVFLFTDLIDGHNLIEDVVERYPATRDVFEANAVRRCCWGCAVRTAALRGGIELSSLLDALNRVAVGEPVEAAR